MDTPTLTIAAEPAYRAGSHQSLQGWLVLLLVAIAIIVYRRQEKTKIGPEKPNKKPWGKKLMKLLGLKKKKKKGKKKTSPPQTEPVPFLTKEQFAPFKEPSLPIRVSGVSGDLMRKLQEDAWTRMVEEKKIPGLVWQGVEESPFGVHVRVEFKGTMNYSGAQGSVRHIEAGLDVAPDTVRPKPGTTSGWGYVEIRTRTPFPDGLPWSPPTGPVRLADPVHLATTPDGDQVLLNVKQRILVSGESGSGKSGTQRVIAAHVILSEDAKLEFWDLKRVEATAYEGKATCVTTVQEAADRLVWLMEEEYPRRMDLMIERKVTGWEESPQDPALVLMVDEGNDLMREFSTDQKVQLFSAVEKGRALGVYFVWATQFPKSTNLPTELRSQFSAKACMRLSSIRESRVVLDEDDVAVGWSPHLLDAHWTLLKDGDNKTPREALVVDCSGAFGKLALGSPAEKVCAPEPLEGDEDMSLEDGIMLCLLTAPGPMSGRVLADELGKPVPTVARVVAALVKEGRLVRDGDGLRMNSAPKDC